MITIVECKNCGGKGHCADEIAILGLTIFGIFLASLKRNDPTGITRQICPKCNGKGYRKIKNVR